MYLKESYLEVGCNAGKERTTDSNTLGTHRQRMDILSQGPPRTSRLSKQGGLALSTRNVSVWVVNIYQTESETKMDIEIGMEMEMAISTRRGTRTGTSASTSTCTSTFKIHI